MADAAIFRRAAGRIESPKARVAPRKQPPSVAYPGRRLRRDCGRPGQGLSHSSVGAVRRLAIELGGLGEESLGEGAELAGDPRIPGGVRQSKAPLGLFAKKG